MLFNRKKREESETDTDVDVVTILSDSKNRYLARYQFRCDFAA